MTPPGVPLDVEVVVCGEVPVLVAGFAAAAADPVGVVVLPEAGGVEPEPDIVGVPAPPAVVEPAEPVEELPELPMLPV